MIPRGLPSFFFGGGFISLYKLFSWASSSIFRFHYWINARWSISLIRGYFIDQKVYQIYLVYNGRSCVSMFVLVSVLCSVPYHEVVRIFQSGFQPQATDTSFLDSGFPHAILDPGNKLYMPMKREKIIHRLLYNRY